jgi:hypothetical protein
VAPFWPRCPLIAGADLGGKSSRVAPGGPVERMNSAKSPIESRSTLASRACPTLGRTFAPELAAGRPLERCVGEMGVGGFECSAVNLEAFEPVRGLSPPLV